MASRLGVIFDQVSQNTETKEITTPVRRKGSTFRANLELKAKTNKTA